MALSYTPIVGLSSTFDPPVIHGTVTDADVGKSAEFLHKLKRCKANGHSTVVTSEHLGQAELIHKKILDRGAHAGDASGAAQFTQDDRDKMNDMQATMDSMQATMDSINAKLDTSNAKLNNLPKRLANSRAVELHHSLLRLGVEETASPYPLGTKPNFRRQADGGAGLPSIFPTTKLGLTGLGAADLNELEEFYGVRFAGSSKAARQFSFMEYIGLA